jgi:hypothetical protein
VNDGGAASEFLVAPFPDCMRGGRVEARDVLASDRSVEVFPFPLLSACPVLDGRWDAGQPWAGTLRTLVAGDLI